MPITNTKKRLSFKKGMEGLKLKDVENFYKKIALILGISSKRTINHRLKKGGVFSPVEYNAIVELFKDLGVTGKSYEEVRTYLRQRKKCKD